MAIWFVTDEWVGENYACKCLKNWKVGKKTEKCV